LQRPFLYRLLSWVTQIWRARVEKQIPNDSSPANTAEFVEQLANEAVKHQGAKSSWIRASPVNQKCGRDFGQP
jgi:hypothetical protein